VWRLVHHEITVPPTAASVFITFDTDSAIDYLDIAEVRLVVKP
jgi:hypothetical protein